MTRHGRARAAGCFALTSVLVCACGSVVPPDAALLPLDANDCVLTQDPESLIPLEGSYLHAIGEVGPTGTLVVGTGFWDVLVGDLRDIWFRVDWREQPRWAASASIALAGASAAMAFDDEASDDLWNPQVLRWRARRDDDASEVSIPVGRRWPLGRPAVLFTARCLIGAEHLAPTPTRLWVTRPVALCPEHPEDLDDWTARLHGFRADGTEVTPVEGIPLGGVVPGRELTPCLHGLADGGLSYLLLAYGPERRAATMRWEHRDATGAVVAEARNFIDPVEVAGGVRSPWTTLTSDGATLLYADVGEVATSVLARIEGDGTLRWLHRIEGWIGNYFVDLADEDPGRVAMVEGGLLALLTRHDDPSEHTIVWSDADGALLIEPGEWPLRERWLSAAIDGDRTGVTVAVVPEPGDHVLVRRYSYAGELLWERAATHRIRGHHPRVIVRMDGAGRTWVFARGHVGGLEFQHYDELGRPGAMFWGAQCIDRRDNRAEAIPNDRPPLDPTIDAGIGRRDGGPRDVDADELAARDGDADDVDLHDGGAGDSSSLDDGGVRDSDAPDTGTGLP